ncbi:MAG: tetratricopeptide repeat protein [Candidatus Eisenbacteria bacterium]|nr:tetratricopeptide repeat protein [Candidatus Eisenbacteria bacterium]
MSPLYPYFLATVYRLFGRDLLLVRMIQAVIGSGSAVLAYVIGRGVFDRRTGVLAGLLTACYGALIFYDGSILMTPLLVFLSLLAVASIIKADASDKPIYYAAGGFALGLAAIGRAAALVSAAVVVVWIVLYHRSDSGSHDPAGQAAGGVAGSDPTRDRAQGRAAGRDRTKAAEARRGRAQPRTQKQKKATHRAQQKASVTGSVRALRSAAFVVIGLMIVVVPVTIRNYVVARDFVPITSNGGLNFYIGNSEAATGGYARPEGLDIVTDPDGEAIAERATGRDLKPSEVSAYWYARARTFIVSHPGDWARLLVRKTVFAVSSYELPQLENYYFQRRYAPLLRLPLPGFAVLGPLGLLGLGLSLRRRLARLLGLFTVAYLSSIVAFFVVARYRLPVVPLLVILASYAAFELWNWVLARRYLRMSVALSVLVVLAFLVNANLYGIDRTLGFAQPHFRLGIIYAQRGMADEAIHEFERAISLDPRYEKSYLNLGAVLSEGGQTERAIDVFRRAIRLDPSYGLARVNLAMALENLGEYDGALAQIDTVLVSDPADAMALKEKGVILYRAGRLEDAAVWLRAAVERDPTGEQTAEAEFYLGLIEGPRMRAIPEAAEEAMARADTLTVTGRITEAVEVLEDARELAPESGEPLRRLALIKRDMGLLDEAIATMREALSLEPTLKGGHFILGVFLNEAGRHDEAIREYEAAIRMSPDMAAAHLNLALTYNFHAGNPNLAANHYRRYLALGGEKIDALEGVLDELEERQGR